MLTKKCRECGSEFEPKKPQTTLCRDCRRDARALEAENSDQLPEITSVDRVLSRGTAASNPGHVRVNWLHTFRSWPLQTSASVIFSMIVGIVTLSSVLQKTGRPGIAAIAGGIAGIAMLFLIWVPWSRVMIYGCANPGIVVDAEKGLVAVMTDLDCGGGESFQVVKIVKQPLHCMTDGPPENGQRLGTVAGYSGDGSKGHWDTFEPYVVGCITHDSNVIDRILNSFEEEDWQTLKLGLKEVPKPYKTGQWRVLQDTV